MLFIKSFLDRTRVKFQKLDDKNDEAKFHLTSRSPSEGFDQSYRLSSRRKSWSPWVKPVIQRLTLLCHLLFIIANAVLCLKLYQKLHPSSEYSSVWQDFPGEHVSMAIDLSFYTDEDDPRHIYRRMPSPEVDHAWYKLGEQHDILIDRQDIEEAGFDLRSAIRAPKFMTNHMNVTGEKYLAIYNPSHHLHCLDAVRKALFADYYYDAASYELPYFLPHRMHCLDAMRQKVMCHSTKEDYLALAWGEKSSYPWMPRTQIQQCTDWEATHNWAKCRAVPLTMVEKMEKPEDVVEVPMQKEWWALLPTILKHMAKYPDLWNNDNSGHH